MWQTFTFELRFPRPHFSVSCPALRRRLRGSFSFVVASSMKAGKAPVPEELEPHWVSPKRRPKPFAPSATVSEVSRHSGLVKTTGTFGKAERFSKRVDKGNASPNRNRYYHNNRQAQGSFERGISNRSTGLGVDQRHNQEHNGTPTYVGPGSYDVVTTASIARSPLDGKDSCYMTMGFKLGSSISSTSITPGPGNIRKDLDYRWPGAFAKSAPLSRGGRLKLYEEGHDAGFESNNTVHESIARNGSCPNLRGLSFPRPSKYGTFGPSHASRFGAAKKSCSPSDVRYYDHSKIMSGEDYFETSRSCSFGGANKTDFANRDVQHKWYSPTESTTGKTSALDGFTRRCHSPVKNATPKGFLFSSSTSSGSRYSPQASVATNAGRQAPQATTTSAAN